MAEFNTFIKLHRSILESAVFTDAEVLRLWIYLLCKASVDDRKIIMNGRVVNISRGQLVTGRKALAANIGTTESKVYRSLKLLQELGCISVEVNNKFSLVTIENWGKFQDTPQKVNSRTTAKQQQTNNRTTTDEQQNNTNNNDNNVKECYNVKEIKEVSPAALQKIVSLFFEKWGKYPTEKEEEKLKGLLSAVGEEWSVISAAFDIATDAGKISLPYVQGICINTIRQKSETEETYDEKAAERLRRANQKNREEKKDE